MVAISTWFGGRATSTSAAEASDRWVLSVLAGRRRLTAWSPSALRAERVERLGRDHRGQRVVGAEDDLARQLVAGELGGDGGDRGVGGLAQRIAVDAGGDRGEG